MMGTHRSQRQAEVCRLVFHLELDLVKKSLDSFLLKTIPTKSRVNFKRLVSTVELQSLSHNSLYNVINGLVDNVFDSLAVLFSHSLQTDTERGLFSAAIISAKQPLTSF